MKSRKGYLGLIPILIGIAGLLIGPASSNLGSTALAQSDPTVMVQVTILRVREIGDLEEGDEADFDADIIIDGEEFDVDNVPNDDDITPNWKITRPVPATASPVPVEIEIWEVDDGFRGGDDHADIKPGDGKDLELKVAFEPCLVISVDFTSECGVTLQSQGTGGDAAAIEYRVEVLAGPSVTARLTITRVREISDLEEGGAANFDADVIIDGEEFDVPDMEEDDNDISPNWQISKVVPLSRTSIPLEIEIWEADSGLRGDDDHTDINPGPGYDLELTVTLTPCEVSGSELSGACGVILQSQGNDDGDAVAIEFRVDIFNVPPPSAQDLYVRCLHNPIQPLFPDTVTFTAEALDADLGPRTVDKIEIWIDDKDAPAASETEVSETNVTAGPFAIRPTFAYGCLVQDEGVSVWSGWHVVTMKDNVVTDGAKPVLITGKRSSSLDIVFVADEDSYSGSNDPAFLEDVHDAIRSAYYAGIPQDVGGELFLEHQDKFNFWIANSSGRAVSSDNGCGHVAPSLPWAESVAILHLYNPMQFRDCVPYAGSRLFSSNADSYLIITHETGHALFGLADEYCDTRPQSIITVCDGGYFQPDPFPNLYAELEDCQADAPSVGRTAADCQEFIAEGGSPDDPNATWSTSDPAFQDMMVDKARWRELDIRRIEWVFETCDLDLC